MACIVRDQEDKDVSHRISLDALALQSLKRIPLLRPVSLVQHHALNHHPFHNPLQIRQHRLRNHVILPLAQLPVALHTRRHPLPLISLDLQRSAVPAVVLVVLGVQTH